MVETFQNLYLGFAVALSPGVLWYGFIGCLVGTLVGVLPGVGPLAGISLLLPITFGLDATRALVMLAGIYYGAMYGGSTTSILMRIPGEAASVMTCIDGYAMARQGRAGPALAIAAVGSYVAGTFSVVALMFLAPPLASFALRFGPAEYFALLLLGLLVLAYMNSGSMLRGLAMAAFGLLLGMVGIDQMSGYFRFAYGITELGDGIGVVPVAVGLFGLAEILVTAGQPTPPEVIKPRLRELLPSRREWGEALAPIGRGTVLGFLIGIIPGSAHVISTFVSYAIERKLSRHPERFGKGAVAGVAGPESANNSATSGAFVPMLALGVPGVPVAALLLAAMMIHGVTPGPLLITTNPQLFWGFESRREHGLVACVEREQVHEIEIAATRDGRILALRDRFLHEMGAYTISGLNLPQNTMIHSVGPYVIPGVELGMRAVVTNTTPVGAYRGAGRPQGTAVVERAMDALARELGMDPVELRRRNLVPPERHPYDTGLTTAGRGPVV